jgi:hypothetical protein
MAENILNKLTNDGHSGAQMTLAHWRLTHWQQGNLAANEMLPQDVCILLQSVRKNRTEGRPLLG